eukprot:gene17180-20468_t
MEDNDAIEIEKDAKELEQEALQKSEEKARLLEELAELEAEFQQEDIVNPKTGEIGGPKGPEPTRYGDWERKVPNDQKIIVVTSGKGGTGKTTSSSSFSFGLAEKGYKVCVIDFDIGLRNLDIHFGMERRVVFDFVNVLNGDCTLRQALIKDRRNPNLHLLAASQTKDKTALKMEEVERVLEDLRQQFDYVICDSPAGIESGAHHSMYWSDQAIITTNPELSSVRDSDKMIGIITSKSKRALEGAEPVKLNLLVTRYSPERAAAGNMLAVKDIQENLGIKLIGVIPESQDILTCTNLGKPVITLDSSSDPAEAYRDVVDRFLGENKPWRFLEPKPTGLFSRKSFSGWQRLSHEVPRKPVQQVLEDSLETLLRTKVKIVGSSRTDSGVNALNQVAHFDIDKRYSKKGEEVENLSLQNHGAHAEVSAAIRAT